MDRAKFFSAVKISLFAGKLSQSQVDGMNAMLDEFEAQHIARDQQAYMLATAYHETATHMQPVIETRQPNEATNPSVDTAIARLESSWSRGHLPWVKTPYRRKDAKGRSYLGRGLPQLTHMVNYDKVGRAIGVDLVSDPDQALRTDIAVKIMIAGMTLGIFTGRKMSDFLDGVDEADAEDYREFRSSRVIVNGMDKADVIAAEAIKFEAALKAAA
jgi:predicted chitinase